MSSLLQSLTSCLQKTTHLRSQAPNTILKNVSFTPISHFSTTKPILARAGKGAAPKVDSRITLIRYHMQHPKTPRPLRFSRMRALRHWTIHRAWMLFRRKQRDCERLELERLYNSTHAAMEALRTLDGPGMTNGGRLYRVALEKKGIFGPGGVPIEYARPLVDTPGREPWNHDWKR